MKNKSHKLIMHEQEISYYLAGGNKIWCYSREMCLNSTVSERKSVFRLEKKFLGFNLKHKHFILPSKI